MKNNKPQTALITGASRGIGLELARQFAHRGYHLVLVSSNEQRLDKVAEEFDGNGAGMVRSIVVDLAQPESPRGLFKTIGEDGTQIDVLVNNAGVGVYGRFAENDLDQELRMIQLNVLSLTSLTKLFLEPMLERGEGRILNIASLAAYQPGGPRMAVYYATKSFVLSFTKALGVELRGTGVKATALCPGPVKTGFESRSGADRTVLYRLPKLSSKRVARVGLRGTRRGRSVVIPGLLSKILAFTGELPPRRIALEVNNLLLKQP